MGCSFVKAANNGGPSGSKGGSRASSSRSRRKGTGAGTPNAVEDLPLPEPPAPAPVDPRIPLTVQQCFKIGKSWKGIFREMELTGVNMFIKLFEEHEDLLTLFTKFNEVRTREMQLESLELREHATIVMTTLDDSIRALEDADTLFNKLYRVGKLHRNISGFQKEYFWHIEKPFLEAVQETLGDRYTENMASIYTITIKFILETLIKGYEQAENEEKTNNL